MAQLKMRPLDRNLFLASFVKQYRTLIIFVATVALVGLATHGDFFSARNLTNLTRQVCINGILSVGMTYVILTGGIDLSVGSVAALSGVVAGIVQVNWGMSEHALPGAVAAFLAAVATGTLCGFFNGYTIVRSKVVPFIITLGLMVITRGLALIFAKGAAIAPFSESFNYFGQGYLDKNISTFLIVVLTVFILYRILTQSRDWIAGGLNLIAAAVFIFAFQGYRDAPIPAILFGVLAFVANFILLNTVWGRYTVATGSNPQAAFLSGVPVERITLIVYVFMGMLAGLSGAVLSARLNGAMPTAGDLFELDAIAAVVIGGTRLTGGVGTIGGSVLGAFLIGTLNNGMSLLNVNEFYQKVIKGVIIIAAVWIDTRGRNNRK